MFLFITKLITLSALYFLIQYYEVEYSCYLFSQFMAEELTLRLK